MIKGVIFDYGGTLDTNSVHWSEVIWEGFQQARVPVTKEQFRMAYVHGERSLAKFPLIHPEHNMLDLLRIKLNIETSFLVDAHLWEGMEGKGKEAERQTISDTIAQYCYDYVVRTLQVARPIVAEWSRLYPLVLVSNFYGNINTILEDFRLDTYFGRDSEARPAHLHAGCGGVATGNRRGVGGGRQFLQGHPASPQHGLPNRMDSRKGMGRRVRR